MPRVFEYEDGKCMIDEKKCHGRCGLWACPVRTPENSWRSHNSIYGFMGSKEKYSKLFNSSIIKIIKQDKLKVKKISKKEKIYMDTDSIITNE